MKKLMIIALAIASNMSAFAYYDSYGYSSHNDEMSGFEIFLLIVMIIYIILSIIILVRWWNMTSDVKQIKEHLTPDMSDSAPKLTYLVATGNIEKANNEAIKMLINQLFSDYYSPQINNNQKAAAMNNYLKPLLKKMERLGLTLPEYVKSGENFINYMNSLTGRNIPINSNQA